MWTPSRRSVLATLFTGAGAGSYGAGRLWCHESGCGNEQTAHLVASPLDPVWKFDYYDPAWYLQNDPGNEVVDQTRIVAGGDQVIVKRGDLSSFDAAGDARMWSDKTVPYRPNPAIELTEEAVLAHWIDTDNETATVRAFRRSDGAPLWTRNFGDDDLDGVETTARSFAWESGGTLRVLDAQTGRENWQLDELSNVMGLAASNQLVYTLSTGLAKEGQMHSLVSAIDEQSGEQKWEFLIEGELTWIDASENAVIAGNANKIVGLTPETGDSGWKRPIAENGNPDITLENGAVIIHQYNEYFYVLDSTSGEYEFGTSFSNSTELTPRATADAVFVPYNHENNIVLPEVGEGLYRFNRETGEYAGRRIFDSYFRDTAVTGDTFFTINDTSLWAFA